MKKCIKCGSHAFNLYAEEIDQGGLCDVHYWQGRAHRAEALAQPEQEPVAVIDVHEFYDNCANFSLLQKLPKGKHTLYTTPPKQEPHNFCPRCGKRTPDLTAIHTCTPPRGLEMT